MQSIVSGENACDVKRDDWKRSCNSKKLIILGKSWLWTTAL
jgi:hypothetical protein